MTFRDTTVFMGPLGAGPLLWHKLTQGRDWDWAQRAGYTVNPCPRKLAFEHPNALPWSARYYKAIDAIDGGRRIVCKRHPCSACNLYLERLGAFP